MPKWLPLKRLYSTKISTLVLCLLYYFAVFVSVTHFSHHNYSHIPIEELDSYLFKKTNPNLPYVRSFPYCKYELSNKTYVYDRDLSLNFDDFLATGIVNGSYSPAHCNPQFSVALLVTYRNRQSQLDIFLPYMHNFLRKQNIHYKIFIIEQQDDKPWNKGSLYNIGAKYAIAEKFPCLILHDIDLLPLDESNLYVCLKEPRHFSALIDIYRYLLAYNDLAGGVLSITAEQYIRVNGLSNKYKGWGGEDDDLTQRIHDNDLKILRLPRQMSRYKMLRHVRQKVINKERYHLLEQTKQMAKMDGLNSVSARSLHVKKYRLFTLIGVRF